MKGEKGNHGLCFDGEKGTAGPAGPPGPPGPPGTGSQIQCPVTVQGPKGNIGQKVTSRTISCQNSADDVCRGPRGPIFLYFPYIL